MAEDDQSMMEESLGSGNMEAYGAQGKPYLNPKRICSNILLGRIQGFGAIILPTLGDLGEPEPLV